MVDQLLIATIEQLIEQRAGQRILLMTGGVLLTGLPIDEREFITNLPGTSHPQEISSAAGEAQVIHLKDVVVTDNGATRQLAYWRGDLDAVSGWSPVTPNVTVLEAFEESWRQNEAGYRYLAGR